MNYMMLESKDYSCLHDKIFDLRTQTPLYKERRNKNGKGI